MDLLNMDPFGLAYFLIYAILIRFYVILQVHTSENYIFINYFIINYFNKIIIIHKNYISCLNKFKNKLIQIDP
jgi:hypothetical protein